MLGKDIKMILIAYLLLLVKTNLPASIWTIVNNDKGYNIDFLVIIAKGK